MSRSCAPGGGRVNIFATLMSVSYGPSYFTKLNDGWDAEPNAPMPEGRLDGQGLALTFFLNAMIHEDVRDYDRGEPAFAQIVGATGSGQPTTRAGTRGTAASSVSPRIGADFHEILLETFARVARRTEWSSMNSRPQVTTIFSISGTRRSGVTQMDGDSRSSALPMRNMRG